MEPIGAAASLVTLLAVSKGIADRGLLLVKRYRGYSAAQAVVRDRLLQLEVQLSLLNEVKKAISESNILSDDVKTQLLESLCNTHFSFESIRDLLAQNSEEGGTRARLRWARKGEAEVRDWVEKLAQHGQSLGDLLSTLQVKLSAHSLKISEASDSKLALIVKNQDEEKQTKKIARFREIRNRNERVRSRSDEGMLWCLLLRLPPGIRNLTFLQNYKVQFSFSVLCKPIIPHNIVPDSAEIFEACKSGDALGVKHILDSGEASPRDTTSQGSTPLRFAIESGSMSLVQLLLDYGADPDTPFGQMQTSPIAWAFGARQIEIARFLHSRGADIDSPNTNGWTPLFYLFGSIGSVDQDHSPKPPEPSLTNNSPISEYIQFLTSSSPLHDINARDSRGFTSLHRASIHGQGPDILPFIHAQACLSPKTKLLQ
ncbi:hypothetical protein ONS95_005719 [Cadophora gregata]|uniref:uncharacterized protein n=1 Tax=Cadophora gregata TaxID=51156 RepID=UPI0026DC0357|nr:uncharacterized protein ONS95_005719 [Cadophora gregata]KAK0103712.1 hypothetical protein ONS95_005719 [Cadophora gregata]